MHMPTFWTYVRRAPLGGRMLQSQMAGIERILAAWRKWGDGDDRKLAYVLATGFHETGARMQPVRETFAASDEEAKERLEKAWRSGKLKKVSKPYWREGYFGRGDVQLTHRANYEKMGNHMGVDLVGEPKLALDPALSARIMIEGMTHGMFTGQPLVTYFSPTREDPVEARRVVNGTNKAELIAGYYTNFRDAIAKAKAVESGADDEPDIVVTVPELGESDDKTPGQSGSLITVIAGIVSGIIVPLVNGLDDLFSLIGFFVVVAAAGALGWLIVTGRLKILKSISVK